MTDSSNIVVVIDSCVIFAAFCHQNSLCSWRYLIHTYHRTQRFTRAQEQYTRSSMRPVGCKILNARSSADGGVSDAILVLGRFDGGFYSAVYPSRRVMMGKRQEHIGRNLRRSMVSTGAKFLVSALALLPSKIGSVESPPPKCPDATDSGEMSSIPSMAVELGH